MDIRVRISALASGFHRRRRRSGTGGFSVADMGAGGTFPGCGNQAAIGRLKS
jgi:hypothetical protein